LMHDRGNHPRPYDRGLGLSQESLLRRAADDANQRTSGIARHVLPILAACRVFHFHDTSPDAPVKRRTDDADNLTLAPDARNLAPLLARLRIDDPKRYQRIIRTVRTVAPFFDDFVLEPEAGRMRLRWQEKGLDDVFSADELSDGTLRFICLAALLLQPERPGTVVLDEPELGLHPFAINQLANLIRSAAVDGRKVVLATQSVTLLSHFEASEVAVVERGARGTQVSRLNPAGLSEWLDDYSLGELWEKNLLGGRPRPDSVAPPREVQDR
jgi:predicted ATPase